MHLDEHFIGEKEKHDSHNFLKRPTVVITRELGDHQTMVNKKATDGNPEETYDKIYN